MGRHVLELQTKFIENNIVSNYIEEETPYEKMVTWWTKEGYPGTFNEKLYKMICDERNKRKNNIKS